MKIILTARPTRSDKPVPPSKTVLYAPDDASTAIRLRDDQEILHIYLDEAIPGEISSFIDLDSRQDTELTASSGRITFGDKQADIPPGRYNAVVHDTAFPDELIEKTTQDELGEMPKPAPKLPTWIIWGSGALFIGLWLLGLHAYAAACFFIPFIGWRLVSSSKAYHTKASAVSNWNAACDRLEEERFPDVVVQMTAVDQ